MISKLTTETQTALVRCLDGHVREDERTPSFGAPWGYPTRRCSV